ncbi:MAG TPA: hypothetical protein VNK23_05335 [Candidatus Dormibacteraeota bacterium]|nr:hypothetical protein [Candidatus Dormibacteraeota bacterium]
MKTHVRTVLFFAALVASAALAFSPVYGQQSNSGKAQHSTGGGKPGIAHQEFGPQSVPKRGDRMGVVGNPNQGGGTRNAASPSRAAKHSAARVKPAKHQHHANSAHPAHSHRSH